MKTEPTSRVDDLRHMATALSLARRGLGRVWPNPAVGCVLVAKGVVVGRGWTQPGGRPHAETEALDRAGNKAAGATAYVSLEPCAHHGQTPPCADSLIAAGIARCVIALEDPDPRVAGKGIDKLRAAGIEVDLGVCAAAAADLNVGFLSRLQQGRPLFTVKSASTLDGRIATHNGDSRWITGPEARAAGHLLRATHDAIMVGVGTALADNPLLDCRLPGMADRSPVRIVFDSHLRLPLTSKMVAGAEQNPLWIFALEGGETARRRNTFVDCGVKVFSIGPDRDGNPDLHRAAAVMAGEGLTRVLVEGGSHLIAALFEEKLVDRVAWMRAPMVIGGDGVPALQAFGVDRLADATRFKRTGYRALGADIMETFDVIEDDN